MEEATSSTTTARDNSMTPSQGQQMVGFEPGVGFENGEDSDHDGELDDNEEEWGGGILTGGPELSESAPTDSEIEVHKPDWGEWYLKCPRWGEVWLAVTTFGMVWPPGFQKDEGKLWKGHRLCIPPRLQNAWVRDHHFFLGHVGRKLLRAYLAERFAWADDVQAKHAVGQVAKFCQVCQVCSRFTSFKARLRPSPIPEKNYVKCRDRFSHTPRGDFRSFNIQYYSRVCVPPLRMDRGCPGGKFKSKW